MLTKCQALFWALYYFTCFNSFNPHNNLVGKTVSLLLPYSWWIWAAQNNLPMVLQLVRFNTFSLNEWINEQMIECMNRGARTMEGIVWGSGRKGRKRKVTSAVIRLISRFLPLTSPFFLPPDWPLGSGHCCPVGVSPVLSAFPPHPPPRHEAPEHSSCEGWWHQALWLWVRTPAFHLCF